ncbi:hypothetical protein [Brevibacillus migulae]|uniref:hypothetical protein n=1 Tax=Brevibacillus migulae TaxID=1644114 RepID=UPI001F1796DC|nr:hypothetical protein [Brevibacillus migulae]
MEERGSAVIHAIYLIGCFGGLLSILLFVEQVSYLDMRVQHTADLTTKAARVAGEWQYYDQDTGSMKKRLFETTKEAKEHHAEIIRGAKEEAVILLGLNADGLEKRTEEITIIHQKGNQKSLYKQGIYHVRIWVKSKLPLFLKNRTVTLERVSQSEVRSTK